MALHHCENLVADAVRVKTEYASMIKPGLLTASTNKADHLRISTSFVPLCPSGNALLSLQGCWSLACRMRFPFRSGSAARVGGPAPHLKGRTKWRTGMEPAK